jgi:hypothetical protein
MILKLRIFKIRDTCLKCDMNNSHKIAVTKIVSLSMTNGYRVDSPQIDLYMHGPLTHDTSGLEDR